VLAIDLGTSGPKVAIVGDDGEIVSHGQQTVDTIAVSQDEFEQDPRAVWRAVRDACREAIAGFQQPVEKIIAVICSSQYSSIVPVDELGDPTMNMILWHSQRGEKKNLAALPGFPARVDNPLQMLHWIRIHGLPPVVHGNESISHMRWVKFAQPEIYRRTYKFLEPMDYVSLCLTGRFTANQNTMFMSLAIDNRSLESLDYHPRLIKQSLLDVQKLPELVPMNTIIGKLKPGVAEELGLSPETVVVTGINDSQAGGIATGAFAGDRGGISIGSTSVIITHVPFKRTSVRTGILSMPSPVPKTYFVTAENGIAGGALQHFLRDIVFASDHFGDTLSDDEFDALHRAVTSVPPGSDHLLFLPWMSGTIAPTTDQWMRGAFLNLSLRTTRAHMARAVLEGVALNIRWLKTPVEQFAKRPFRAFRFYGGGAQSDVWSQILADVLGVPVHQLSHPRYVTCVGGALLAFERLGRIKFDEFESRIRVQQVYQPRSEYKATYDRLYDQFVAAFRANRKIFRRLNSDR
jgi:xylulokinase